VSVTFPEGFRAAGVTAGLKPSGRPDLGLLAAEGPASVAGLFTTNAFPAAPVRLSRDRIRRAGGIARAVVVNSGQANAATGEPGDADALTTTVEAARLLDVDPAEVLACSTGVIGERIPMDTLAASLPELVGTLSSDGGEAFAEAIMTTDTVPKQATAVAGPYRVGGCAKGVGMIAPNLATMLAFLTTDAHLEPSALSELAHRVARPAFESLTVDACTSTNDTVLLFAGGAAAGDPIAPGSRAWAGLEVAFAEVAVALVEQLAADAEGGSHVVVVEVEGAVDGADARRVAKAVADSPLVKTAAFGGDPNPGRILQAVGSSGATFDPADVSIAIGGVRVVDGGVIPQDYVAGELRGLAQAEMKEPRFVVSVTIGAGPGRGRAIGCDLSYDYVRINAEYTT
jgi:glutamate N-acetyltransferase/amino-acid N-acetyltransferase